jgi:adenosylcobyric acid synthase
MVQGSASGVGKSVIATALCQVLAEAGLRVRPFKAQNMSNNAAVAIDGGEIGRAQAAQASAAGVEASVLMNPILLKPESENRSQLVVLGRAVGTYSAREYWSPDQRRKLWPVITNSLRELRREADVVVIEGAGSPAELNLRARDMANMRLARHVDAAVLLVGDISRGGIFAQLLGTLDLLASTERALVSGLIVNRFRGDRRLFDDGVRILERRSHLPVMAVLPEVDDLEVPAEDSESLSGDVVRDGSLRAALIAYPRISNFDDVDPLRRLGLGIEVVRRAQDLASFDLVVLPGSKATLADLEWLRAAQLDVALEGARAAGVPILGICGGYQMLGMGIEDPAGTEGAGRSLPGLGFLPVVTTFQAEKKTDRVQGEIAIGSIFGAAGETFGGYEIRNGISENRGVRPFASIVSGPESTDEGALSDDGLVAGTSVHGLFGTGGLGQQLVARLAARRGVDLPSPRAGISPGDWLRANIDAGRLFALLDI